MKTKIAWVALVLMFVISTPVYASLIDSSTISVSGTVYNTHLPEHTIDNDLGTFWHGTNDIQPGQTNYLLYEFSQPYSIKQIGFFDDYQNAYYMGELDVQILDNGNWATIEHVAGDFNPSGGDFSKIYDTDYTSSVRLFMTYEGRAAHGGSPAFYLSEIDFYGEPNIIPEPSSLLLLGLGGLLLKRRKR